MKYYFLKNVTFGEWYRFKLLRSRQLGCHNCDLIYCIALSIQDLLGSGLQFPTADVLICGIHMIGRQFFGFRTKRRVSAMMWPTRIRMIGCLFFLELVWLSFITSTKFLFTRLGEILAFLQAIKTELWNSWPDSSVD